jgi:ribosomal protein L31E
VPQKAIFIHITATLQPKPQARLEVRTYDVNLLRQLSDGLNARGIECPPVRLRVTAGYVNGSGVRSNRDLWGLGIHRKQSLRRLSSKRLSPTSATRKDVSICFGL